MIGEAMNRVVIHVPSHLYQELDTQAAIHGKTLEGYAAKVLMEAVEDSSLDEQWAAASEAAKEEGFLSVEDSERLLDALKHA
uniref:Uncharacterized protein n=1 Tax=Candidatus Kentrum sp. TC TaxID=2126339 RepID=A0A450ZA50_9GAMM|nr:MAG: hypothetical protein BECKTC1821D_GA0114238_111513 [Candidatus Kentron sp. TC]